MQYRIMISVFVTETDMPIVKNVLINFKSKFLNIAQEKSIVTIHKCYHDEIPSKECEEIFHWEQT